ncbi:MAG: hypothetical protein KF773_39915 [Deltaproteobacteria bacterium]|nr:hypothetical protein [Deltaproteobacteria bacterium]
MDRDRDVSRPGARLSPLALAFGAGAAVGFLLGGGLRGMLGVTARTGVQAVAALLMRQLATSALAPIVVGLFDREEWQPGRTPVAPPRNA